TTTARSRTRSEVAMTRWPRLVSTIAALVVCAAGAISLDAQQRTVAPTKFTRAPMIQALPPGEIEVLPIRGNLYALFGAGSNIVVSVGPDGVMLVDAGTAGMSDKIIGAVQQLSREWAMRNEPK